MGLVALAIPAVASAASAITRQMESVRRLESELAGLEGRYGQAAEAYQGARTRLSTARTRVAENAAALKKAKADFIVAQSRLAARILDLYRQPQPSGLELILQTGSLTQAAATIDALERVQVQDQDIVTSIAGARERMEHARVLLVADQKVAASEATEATTRFREIASIRSARRGVLISARRQLAGMVAAAQRAQDARRLAALRAAQRRVGAQVGTQAPPIVIPPPALGGDIADRLRQIALCESGGNPTAVSPSGLYRGKYQFDPQTWKSLGGAGDDPAAASEAEQDRVAAILYRQRGSAPWPVCGR